MIARVVISHPIGNPPPPQITYLYPTTSGAPRRDHSDPQLQGAEWLC